MVLIEQSFLTSFRCQQDGVISRGARITGRGFDGLTFENHMEDMLYNASEITEMNYRLKHDLSTLRIYLIPLFEN